MGRVEEAVRSEIMRLVRRELRSVVLLLGKEVRQLKRGMGRLNKSVAGLERVVAAQVREAEARRDRLEVTEEEARTARLSGASDPGTSHSVRNQSGPAGCTCGGEPGRGGAVGTGNDLAAGSEPGNAGGIAQAWPPRCPAHAGTEGRGRTQQEATA